MDHKEEHAYRLDKLDEHTKELSEKQTKLLVDVNKIDESSKSAHKRIHENDEKIKDIKSSQNNLEIKITEMCEAQKVSKDKIEKAEMQTNAILELGMSVKQLTEEIKEIVETYKNHDDRLTALESAPGKTAINFLKKFFWIVVSAGIGILFSKAGVI